MSDDQGGTGVVEFPKSVNVWFCPVCGERMAGKSYEVDELRAKCTKTKHKALAMPVAYLLDESKEAL